jgi:hypothetical protein
MKMFLRKLLIVGLLANGLNMVYVSEAKAESNRAETAGIIIGVGLAINLFVAIVIRLEKAKKRGIKALESETSSALKLIHPKPGVDNDFEEDELDEEKVEAWEKEKATLRQEKIEKFKALEQKTDDDLMEMFEGAVEFVEGFDEDTDLEDIDITPVINAFLSTKIGKNAKEIIEHKLLNQKDFAKDTENLLDDVVEDPVGQLLFLHLAEKIASGVGDDESADIFRGGYSSEDDDEDEELEHFASLGRSEHSVKELAERYSKHKAGDWGDLDDNDPEDVAGGPIPKDDVLEIGRSPNRVDLNIDKVELFEVTTSGDPVYLIKDTRTNGKFYTIDYETYHDANGELVEEFNKPSSKPMSEIDFAKNYLNTHLVRSKSLQRLDCAKGCSEADIEGDLTVNIQSNIVTVGGDGSPSVTTDPGSLSGASTPVGENGNGDDWETGGDDPEENPYDAAARMGI